MRQPRYICHRRFVARSAGGPRALVPDPPDSRGPELGEAHAHALKSVTVGRDGSVYYSVGSTEMAQRPRGRVGAVGFEPDRPRWSAWPR